MDNFTFYQHLKTRRVISTSQMLFPVFETFFGVFSLPIFHIRAVSISPLHCQVLRVTKLSLRKTSNIMKKKEENIKEKKLATSSPMGHILTGLASSSVSSTKNMLPPQLLLLLPLLLWCVSPGYSP